ncbi:TSUP family transporter [Embleya sp. NPDC050493]|uniref:sulfite exporter TauE/SafE family protein n=1 Tax=Embleya sp. NPDC050493 TaxID=3363989 RepID=UPI003794044C
MSPAEALLVLVAGLGAGTVNTVVGSGSLLTFPVLLALGYPPVVANVSNTIGLTPGSITGALGYRLELAAQSARLLPLSIAAVLGGTTGGLLLLTLPPGAFRAAVPALILLAALLMAAQPWLSRRLALRRDHQTEANRAGPTPPNPDPNPKPNEHQASPEPGTPSPPAHHLRVCRDSHTPPNPDPNPDEPQASPEPGVAVTPAHPHRDRPASAEPGSGVGPAGRLGVRREREPGAAPGIGIDLPHRPGTHGEQQAGPDPGVTAGTAHPHRDRQAGAEPGTAVGPAGRPGVRGEQQAAPEPAVAVGRVRRRGMRRERQAEAARASGVGPVLLGAVFTVSVYGGYFGAAQGVLLLALLAIVLDEDLNLLNGLKNLLQALVNLVAAVLFAITAEVAWLPVLLLALGSVAGGRLGAVLGRRVPAPVLRALVVVIGTTVGIALLVT